jgi:MoxR-like ATPase
VQSALLEVMQERQVTIAGETHKVPSPFVVMATQNPIETEGTYPLPEAQVDRFMMKVLVDYPSADEEFVIVQRVTGERLDLAPVASLDDLRALQAECQQVYVDPALVRYAVNLVMATRNTATVGLPELKKYITFGSSPRGTINLIESSRALALMRGRRYVLAEDVIDLAHDVLRHRVALSYEAISEGVSADAVLTKLMSKIAAPVKPMQSKEEELKRAA